jgi:hypothetical protein
MVSKVHILRQGPVIGALLRTAASVAIGRRNSMSKDDLRRALPDHRK